MLLLIACTEAPPLGLALLGYRGHDAANVRIDTIGSSDDGLNLPRDLAFNPEFPEELWVVNREDDSTTTFFDPGTSSQESLTLVDPYALHFMEEVSSIAFGAPGTFGTCQESRNTYNEANRHDDFMGPALWSSDWEIYAKSNPEAVKYLSKKFGMDVDLGSHLDMLHESPLCMGIAWEMDNVYWVFDGFNGDIVRYDFKADHGAGFDDHSDGIIARYEGTDVGYVEDVPSHMLVHDGLLYFVDTGHAQIRVLDTASGVEGEKLKSTEPGTTHYEVDDFSAWTLIEGADFGITQPSGLAFDGEHLYVTDHATGRIHAFRLDGSRADWLDTGKGAGALMGVEFAQDALWLVDASRDEVFRIRAAEVTED